MFNSIMDNLDATFVLSTITTALTCLLIYHQIKTYTFWSSRGIRGPTPFPFVGTNIYMFFKNRVQLDQEWKDKYGPTFGVYEGHRPVLQTSDPELIKHVNIKHFSSFTDRNSHGIHSNSMKRWLFFSPGDHWSNQRALISPMFSGNKMRNMFSVMASSIGKFVNEVETIQLKAAKELAGGEELYEKMDDVGKSKALIKAAEEKTSFSKDETMNLTLDVIAKTFFSLDMNTFKDKSSEFYKRAFAFSKFDIPYFIMWCFIPSFIARYLKLNPVPESKFEYFGKLATSLVKDRRKKAELGGGGKNDMLQNLIDARIPDKHESVFTSDDSKEAHYNDQMSIQELNDIQTNLEKKSKSFRSFSDEEISGQSIFFFLAGFETTSTSLSFCLYELGHQLEAQEEIFEELEENISSDGELDYSSLMNLKKLEAFISEALRLHNPITQNTRMVTASEGALLPTKPPVQLAKGSVITFSGLVCHRDPEYWEKPLKFDMSRFYPENKHKIKSCTYHPFGVGPRNCVGMRFALLQIRLLLATLLLRYKVLPGPKSLKYPIPDYTRHAFFLQMVNTDFRLIPRKLPVSLV